MRMRDVELPPWLPKTVAKIEKNRIGSRNVSACATRSRFRLVQLDAQQRRDHSLQLPSGQVDEHRLQARAADLDVLDVAPLRAERAEQRRQIARDVGDPRAQHARIVAPSTSTPGGSAADRRVDPQRDDAMAADRLIDQLRQRPGGDHPAVIDDHRARAARLGFFEMMRRQQQRHAVARAARRACRRCARGSADRRRPSARRAARRAGDG